MKLLILVLFVIETLAFAHEGGETTAQVGPGKAVEVFAPDKGFKLSQKAVNMIGIKTAAFATDTPIIAPKKAAISTKEDVAIYIFRDGFFIFTPIKVISQSTNSLTLSSSEIKSGDQIVVEGAALLRVAHLNLLTTESYESEENEHSGEKHTEEEHND